MAPHCKCSSNGGHRKSFVQVPFKRFKKPKMVIRTVLRKFTEFKRKSFNEKFVEIGNFVRYFGELFTNYLDVFKSIKEQQVRCLEQSRIYDRVMKNPKLHVCRNKIGLIRFIADAEKKKCARYYASFLWNWALHREAKQCNKRNQLIKRCVYFTFKSMGPADLEVMKMLIIHNYIKSLPCIEYIESENIQEYLTDQIYSNHMATAILIEVIQEWFLIMPILNELAKCTGWDYLFETKACLLDLDTLYTILLNKVYKTPQTKPFLTQN